MELRVSCYGVHRSRRHGTLSLLPPILQAPCDATSLVCDTTGEKSYRCANDCYPTSQAQEFHKNWWRNSAETLQLEFPLEWDAALGVTPQILSTDIALGLGRFIQERFGVAQWGAYLLDAYAAKHIKNWEERQYLGHDPAWTEYSIYFIFAQHARAFERYHTVGKILQWNAIWEQDQWEKWDACKDTFEWDWGYLGLVQSRLKLPLRQSGPR
ncbi:hypothetical protein WJX84_005774 [Apatococcus fuscideae]|uniref:Uncharacterized protein n=1 Tax=Apatococcus fuscideae TaxID=2026836 RepID=A0AAW1S0R6_9CHLO